MSDDIFEDLEIEDEIPHLNNHGVEIEIEAFDADLETRTDPPGARILRPDCKPKERQTAVQKQPMSTRVERPETLQPAFDTIKTPPPNPVHLVLVQCRDRAPQLLWSVFKSNSVCGLYRGVIEFNVLVQITRSFPLCVNITVTGSGFEVRSSGEFYTAWERVGASLSQTSSYISIAAFFLQGGQT